MSYILDALKRSDHDRQQQRPATLRSIHSAGSAEQGLRRRSLSSPVLWSALTASLLAAAWWWQQDVNSVPARANLSTDAEAVTPTAVQTGAAVAEYSSEKPTASTPPAAQLNADAGSAIHELWELTAAEQRYLETLDISMHVYSTDPGRRTILINGLRLREGQALGQDLQLSEVTPQGISVLFRGRLVNLPVASGWN